MGFQLIYFYFFIVIDILFGFSTCHFQKTVEEDGKLLPEFEDDDESE